MTRVRAVGMPPELARAEMSTVTPAAALAVYAHPRPQLARLTEAGLLHRVAHGYFVVVPQARIGRTWMPELEHAAAGIGVADFGRTGCVVVGLSAARVLRAVPRALAVASVAVPRRRHLVRLIDREANVRFLPADVDLIRATMTRTELGECLVATPEQTVLDLAHRPQAGGDPRQVEDAIRTLLRVCEPAELHAIAAQQRRRAALDRLRRAGLLDEHVL